VTRFLLFLSLIGAAIDALLIYTHDVLTEETAEKTYAEQAQPNHPVQHLSSWGSYLSDRSISQNSQLATLNHPLHCLVSKAMSLAKLGAQRRPNFYLRE
jgi:hypothetical protein